MVYLIIFIIEQIIVLKMEKHVYKGLKYDGTKNKTKAAIYFHTLISNEQLLSLP